MGAYAIELTNPAAGSGSGRLAAVFGKERLRLLQTVRRRLFDVSATDAEDLVQDVFHKILRRGDLIGQIENLTAYVYQALSNRISDHRRTPSREISLDAADQLDDDLLRRALEPVSTDLDPEAQVQLQQLRADIRRALDSLDADDRAIWIETEIQERTFRELSEEWGVPKGTLLSRKHRAGKLLRDRLRELRSASHE